MTIYGRADCQNKRLPILDQEEFDLRSIKDEEQAIEASKIDLSYFEPLYNKYYESLFRYVYRQTEDEDETADIVSKVFLNAIHALPRYEHRGLPFGAWLFRIASNETNKYFRGRKRKVLSLEEQKLRLIMECEEIEDDQQKLKVISGLVNELDQDEIRILELKFFEDKNFKEIAFVLNKKESAIKMRMYRALSKLKVQYEKLTNGQNIENQH